MQVYRAIALLFQLSVYLEGVFEADNVVDPLLEVEDAVLVGPLAAGLAATVAADDDAEREEGVNVAKVAHHRLQRHHQPGLLHQLLGDGPTGLDLQSMSKEIFPGFEKSRRECSVQS